MTEPAEPSDQEVLPSGTVVAVPNGEPLSERSDDAGQLSAHTVLDEVRPLVAAVTLLTLLTGIVFPVFLIALAYPLFPHQAGGSLIVRDGVVVGSELIGQAFTGPGYFQPRPSAAGRGYDGLASGGSNLSPTNPTLRSDVRQLATRYREHNGLSVDAGVPIDGITRSGSGLDPHISPANAALQVPRVARERGLREEQVRRLIADYTRGRQFGVIGEPCVEVLGLNLALDRLAPLPTMHIGR
jgi:K+-transporting ATPase ATPase C chain